MFGTGIGFYVGVDFSPDEPARVPARAPARAREHTPEQARPRTRGPICPMHDRGTFHGPDLYEDEDGRMWRRKSPSRVFAPPPEPKAKTEPKTQPIPMAIPKDWNGQDAGCKTPELSRSPGTDSEGPSSVQSSPKAETKAKT